MSAIIDATDGWLTDWEQSGGRFKEWVRSVSLTSINHGWLYAIYIQPVHWWESFCHVLSWVPILWSDRDWDHVYLLIMMREKLHRMRLHHEEDRVIGDWSKVASQIHVAEALLDRLIKDDYVTEDYEEHMRKYGSPLREPLPDGGSISRPHPDPECSEDIRRIANKEEALKKQDLEFFGRWFAKHCRSWWS